MIHFITGNPGKLREVREIMPNIQVEHLNIDLPEIQEIDAHKIIEAKLREAHKHHQGELIVEDTSLYMDALGGKLPGPMIKWFLSSLGNEGVADIATRFGVHGAYAVTIIGYMDGSGNIRYFEGKAHGNIVSPRGESSFGWDPIFQPDNSIKTFAQMSGEAKNAISHRRKALMKFREYLDGGR